VHHSKSAASEWTSRRVTIKVGGGGDTTLSKFYDHLFGFLGSRPKQFAGEHYVHKDWVVETCCTFFSTISHFVVFSSLQSA